ncbi:Transporter of the ATP-binding cassette (ABC) [Polyrhizophydium stewartii]|uniref:Transporter of the ATP-binding cassette (ABC) n=1 Tax=Polyrhizophydium stewartii TaxID=2732419 RepID=A0ABR4N820_9FUNG
MAAVACRPLAAGAGHRRAGFRPLLAGSAPETAALAPSQSHARYGTVPAAAAGSADGAGPAGSEAAQGSAPAHVWLFGALLSVVVAALSLALAVLECIVLVTAPAPMPASTAVASGISAAAWFAVAVALAANARPLNSIADSGKPHDATHVTVPLVAMLVANAGLHAMRILRSDASAGSLATWISADGAAVAACVAALAVEAARWARIESDRADALESFLASRTDEHGNKIPVPSFEQSASVLSRLLFSWVSPLMRKSSRVLLEHADIWQLAESDQSERLVAKFAVAKRRFKSLFWRLVAVLWPPFLFIILVNVVGAVLSFGSPFFLNRIVGFIEHGGDQPTYIGILFALGLFVTSVLKSWADAQFFHGSRRVGVWLRAILIAEVYQKSLRRCLTVSTLPSSTASDEAGSKSADSKESDSEGSTDEEATLGKIVTLMSVDTRRLREIIAYMPWIFVTPFQITACVLALFSILGWAALAGVAVMIAGIPLATAVSKYQYKTGDVYMSRMDKRVGVVNEMLQGIRIIKYFGWEAEFQKKVEKARQGELKGLLGTFLGRALAILVWESIPLLVSFVTFLTYTKILGKTLDATTAFTSLSLFMTLRFPLMVFPELLMDAVQGMVSLRRIDAFLSQPELDKFQSDKQHMFESDWNQVATRPGFRNATFTWDNDAKADAETAAAQATTSERDPLLAADSQPSPLHHHFVLSDVHVTFPVGCLTAVVGVTGAGKSSIAQALLGEMKMLRGRTVFPSMFSRGAPDFGSRDTSVAYVAQTAWLQNASVRDNILFGAPFDEQRYNQVIEACALVRDLATFPAGDMTEIGEKGINMSGGQKQRISLARACYSAAQFVILDDPLSAVDAPTALHLFDKCIRGILRGRTVVLVTHATGLVLPSADHVVYVKSGRIAAHGSGVDMQRQLEVLGDSFGEHLLHAIRGDKIDGDFGGEGSSAAAGASTDGVDAAKAGKEGASGKLVEDETKQSGAVKAAVYMRYFRAVGGVGFIAFYLVLSTLGRAVQVADDWWLKVWAESYKTGASGPRVNTSTVIAAELGTAALAVQSMFIQSAKSTVASVGSLSITSANSTTGASSDHNVDFYLGVYGVLGLGLIFMSQLLILIYSIGSYRASKEMHAALLARILNAPMRFFDTTPIGRILNRFSKDIESIDSEVGESARQFMGSVFEALCILCIITYVSPLFPLLFIPVVIIFARIASAYLRTSRELRRLESVSQSPIYAKFSETLQGAATIRAFAQEDRFINENFKLVNKNHQAHFFMWSANRWLGIRCEIAASSMVLVTSTSLILARSSIDAGLAGLCLAYALELVYGLIWIIRAHASMEMNMNSVERVDEYLNIDQEAAAIVPSYRPADNWPTHGAIEIQDLSVRYAPDQPRVLDGVSFSVGACEKVGIVGRTGAGKSTLSLALFRIVPHDGGRIVIDGMDIGRMGLWDLRSRLTIIPQDPVLFSGTVRSNLDPFDKHDDAALWASLKRVHFLESLQTKTAVGKAEASDEAAQLASVGSGTSTPSATGSAASGGSLLPIAPSVVRQDSAATAVDGASPVAAGPTAESKGFSLDSVVSENGANLSQGQRQLLCLARALLQASRIIILDEATASVDHATDAKIQSTIRTEFSGASVLTIAHRLSTVMDYDKILVLDHGRVVQFGKPHDLLQDTSGQLYQMCAESGEMDLLVSIAASRATA